ncbi:hypothetical protein [Phyllobacterium chamaecytisi]|uniref:hypothetical protein n=1 Tax=Phyllobacterium chamaecytisi TaxID=2876082 RepID=UPI001CCD9DF1|nr:hypothetical protein [Phyllobacterium sp. KW56]MBZ9603075.1 hypothetical protein [Phyllobacterium sp. KW56]
MLVLRTGLRGAREVDGRDDAMFERLMIVWPGELRTRRRFPNAGAQQKADHRKANIRARVERPFRVITRHLGQLQRHTAHLLFALLTWAENNT